MKQDDISDIYVLTALQQGMLVHGLRTEGAYHCQSAYELQGPLATLDFDAAVQALVARHDALRTAFVWEGLAQPHQVVLHRAACQPEHSDWSAAPEHERESRWAQLLAESAQARFDLARAPLMRLHLVRWAPGVHRLLWTAHHLIIDGWSAAICLAELLAALNGGAAPAPVQTRMRDVVRWHQRPDAIAQARLHWAQALAQHAPLHAFDADADGPVQRLRIDLDAPRIEALRSQARAARVSLNHVVQLAWSVALHGVTGHADLVTGLTISGRSASLPQATAVVGAMLGAVPIRWRADRAATLQQALDSIASQSIAAAELPALPLSEIKHAAGIDAEGELHESIVVFENYPAAPTDAAGSIQLRALDFWQTSHYPLTLVADAQGRLELQARAPAVSGEVAQRLLKRLVRVLHGIGDANLGASVHALCDWDDGLPVGHAPQEPWCAPSHALDHCWRAQVEAAPDALAVIDGPLTLTYRDLDERATRLAHRLLRDGLGRGELVAVCMQRGADAMTALLGVVLAGGAYLPLEPAAPARRLAETLADARVRRLLTDSVSLASLDTASLRGVSCLRVDDADCQDAPATPLPPHLAGDDLAYVMYTSGSTGRPKGVGIPHQAIVRMVHGAAHHRGGVGQRMVQGSTLAFDAATYEIWGALLCGTTSVVLQKEQLLDPPVLAQACRAHGIDTLFLTTALFNHCAAQMGDTLAGLETVMFGGEAADPSAVRSLLERGGRVRLLNMYGPTENATFSTWHPIDAIEPGAATVPIGRAVSHSQCVVLDDSLNPVPVGVAGELLVGGAGLAWGYLGRPGLTAERFIPHPWEAGLRLYRTGDIVRWNALGQIEFVGRRDHQVKLRGHRIELGEIEVALLAQPGVTGACVQVREHAGRRQLVAWCETAQAATPAIAQALRQQLAASLPDYMVPAVVVALDRLPLQESGKVDRDRLPTPDLQASEAGHVAPSSDFEREVAALWQDLLGAQRVGVRDHFFELGGDSLLVMRMLGLLRKKFGLAVGVAEFYRDPHIAALSKCRLQDAETACAGAATQPDPLAVDVPLQLSAQQDEFWAAARLGGGAGTYSVTHVELLEGALDIDRLKAPWNALVARHEALHTGVGSRRPEPLLLDPARAELRVIDLRATPGTHGQALAIETARQSHRREFDLEHEPPARLCVVRLADERNALILTVSHFAVDGVSLETMLSEFAALYEGKAALAPVVAQSRHLAHWHLHGPRAAQRLERERAYWRTRLAAMDDCGALPTDATPPAAPTFAGAVHRSDLPQRTLASLRALARTRRTSLFAVVLSALMLALSRAARRDDVMVATAVANRGHEDAAGVIGCFVNTLPVRLDLASVATGDELVDSVSRRLAQDLDHQGLPFSELAEMAGLPRGPFQGGLRRLMLGFRDAPIKGFGLAGLRGELLDLPHDTARTEITLDVHAHDDGLRILWEYGTELFSARTIASFDQAFAAALQALAEQSGRRLAEIALSTAEYVANDNRFDAEDVWSRFAAQVAAKPHSIALESAATRLTFAELSTRALDWAARLHAAGVGAGDRVALHAARSPRMDRGRDGPVPAWRQLLAHRHQGAGGPRRGIAARRGLCGRHHRSRASASRGQRADLRARPRRRGRPRRRCSRTARAPCLRRRGRVRDVHLGLDRPAQGRDRAASRHPSAGRRRRPGAGRKRARGVHVERGIRREHARDLVPAAQWRLPRRGAGSRCQWRDRRGAGAWPWRELPVPDHRLVQHARRRRTGLLRRAALPHLRRRRRIACACRPPAAPASRAHADQRLRADGEHLPEPRARGRSGPCRPGPDADRPPHPRLAWLRRRPLRAPGAGRHGRRADGGRRRPGARLPRPQRPERRPLRARPWARGRRMYRTGDLVRESSPDTLVFVGREDAQVKLRGFRVELGEIEHALATLPAVAAAAVVVTAGTRRLVAFAVAQAQAERPLDEEEMRDALRSSLPPYMVPERIVTLASIPMNDNGKRDRRALAARAEEALLAARPGDTAEVRDAGPVDARILALATALLPHVAEIVGHASLGIEDDIFEHGGTSLSAVRIQAEMAARHGVRLGIDDIFRLSTVHALAQRVGDAAVPASADPAPRRPSRRARFERDRHPGGIRLPGHPAGPEGRPETDLSLS